MRTVIMLLLVACVACRKESTAMPQNPPAQRVETTTVAAPPVDLKGKEVEFEAPLKPPVISQCKTGSALDANGVVATTSKAFTSKDKIYTTVWLKEAPPKLVMTLRALKGDDEVAASQKPAAGLQNVTLQLDALKSGSYKLETAWGGNIVCEETIEVE